MRRDVLRTAVRFELRRVLRDPYSWAGIAAFTAVLLIGSWLHWQSLPPRPQSSRLFGEAFILALVIGWHAGLARDRGSRFDAYLVANFVGADTLFVAKVCSALVYVSLLSGAGFLLALGASAGDLRYATLYTALFLLAALLMLPALIIIELLLNTRFPVPIVIMLFFAALAIYGRTSDVRALTRVLGMDGNLELWPAVFRSLAALAATAACYPLYRRRLGYRSLAGVRNPP